MIEYSEEYVLSVNLQKGTECSVPFLHPIII